MPKNNRTRINVSVRVRRKVINELLTSGLWSYLKRSGVVWNKNRRTLGVGDALEAVFPKDRSTLFEVRHSSHARSERDE